MTMFFSPLYVVLGNIEQHQSRITPAGSFSSPEPFGLICNRSDHVTKKRRALGTRVPLAFQGFCPTLQLRYSKLCN